MKANRCRPERSIDLYPKYCTMYTIELFALIWKLPVKCAATVFYVWVSAYLQTETSVKLSYYLNMQDSLTCSILMYNSSHWPIAMEVTFKRIVTFLSNHPTISFGNTPFLEWPTETVCKRWSPLFNIPCYFYVGKVLFNANINVYFWSVKLNLFSLVCALQSRVDIGCLNLSAIWFGVNTP
jgi:hypothetical protein